MITFAALHHAGTPLLLPNAWDHASAAALAGAGFPAIGTTSLGVAAAAGLPDGTAATRDETAPAGPTARQRSVPTVRGRRGRVQRRPRAGRQN